MSNPDIDFKEKADFFFSVVPACANCKATGILNEYWTEDDRHLLLCDDCAEEEARTEKLADQLAAAELPSCGIRQQVIESAETTRGLVNAVRAHDQVCACCASTRKTVTEDRLYVAPAAVCREGRAA